MCVPESSCDTQCVAVLDNVGFGIPFGNRLDQSKETGHALFLKFLSLSVISSRAKKHPKEML